MKPEISIIMPAIRPDKWEKVVNSILNSTKRPWELIIISPYQLPEKLQNITNIKYVKDYGSPMRASQIGSLLCEGEVIFFLMADDAVFCPNALDENLNAFYEMETNYKNVVISKYTEGQDGSEKNIQNDDYYKVNGAACTKTSFIPDDYWIFNTGIMYRKFFEELGGWDCQFEACPMGLTDLAIRAQIAGAIVKMVQIQILDVGHMPGTSGDHAPIHYAQILHDEPMYQKKYQQQLKNIQVKIDPMNWKNAPIVWKKRFNI